MTESGRDPDTSPRAERSGRVPRPSILFAGGVPADLDDGTEPAYFSDLNLDQIVARVIAGKDGYRLAPYFYRPLTAVDEVAFRQEVFQDLERDGVWAAVAAFTKLTLAATYAYRAREMAAERVDSAHYHRVRYFLNSAEEYCGAVSALATGLAEAPLGSRALQRLRDYLAAYVGAAAFTDLRGDVRRLEDALDAVRYCIVVAGDRVTVGRYSNEADYSEQVADTFDRFRQNAPTDYRDVRPKWREEDFAELDILGLVARLYPDLFTELDAFCQRYAQYLDEAVALADREFQFYLCYLDYIRPLRTAGLSLTYPRVSDESKHEQALDTFDLALAVKMAADGGQVVCNDLTLRGVERVLVISGPNNGGKTTMARTFGQLHHLARLGCPVPGREVELFLCDHILTQFEKEEDMTTLAGKLQDELNRLHANLRRATPASVVVLNEVFNSTTAADALFLSRKILDWVTELDALGVCVTFLDELSTLNEKTVSMVSQVSPADPAIRTHKVIRVPADGRAYARAIAEKYGLTFEQVTAGRVGI